MAYVFCYYPMLNSYSFLLWTNSIIYNFVYVYLAGALLQSSQLHDRISFRAGTLIKLTATDIPYI